MVENGTKNGMNKTSREREREKEMEENRIF